LTENERLSLGITENLVRLSIGLETVSDLKKDIATALK
jgi:cystathionine beta-lyase/cystathionine gamma-synthase